MATERQILANKQNASRSSGPKTEAGRARSRLNAVKHGMAGQSPEVEAMASTEFLERREKWGEEFAPVGEGGEWAMDRAVAASFRIERCERAIDEIQSTTSERAKLAWDQDRAVEAAIVFNRLERDPVLASRQLQTTFAGVVLLIEAWFGLASTLAVGGVWSEAEVARALDLLGVPTDRRSGRTVIDDPDGGDPAAFRRLLTFEEIERLEALRDQVMAPLEDMEQRQAIAGDIALLSKPAKLVMRYERDAWKRYRESIRQVRESATLEAPEPVALPAPVVEVPPARKMEPQVVVKAAPDRSPEGERRESRAMAAPIREMFGNRLDGEGPAVSAFRVGLPGRSAPNPDSGSVTERTQSAGRPSRRS